MKAAAPRAKSAAPAFCGGCRALETRIDLDGRSNYWCAVRAEQLTGPIIWKRACRLSVSGLPRPTRTGGQPT